MIAVLSALAAASPPQAVTVTYQTRFDLGGSADQLCGVTGLCDCTVTYEGKGTFVRSTGDRHTFQGTYRRTSGSCHDILTLWTPPDQAAYHTIRLVDGQLTEWIAHANAASIEPVRSNIKASGQVWLSDFTAAIDAASHTALHVETDSGNAAGIPIQSTHTLTVVLGH